MAIDLTAIATDITGQVIAEVNNLTEVLSALADLNEFATDAGITTFATYETEVQALFPHLDGPKLNQVLGVILPALKTWLDAQTVSSGDYSGQTYQAMLNKVRSA